MRSFGIASILIGLCVFAILSIEGNADESPRLRTSIDQAIDYTRVDEDLRTLRASMPSFFANDYIIEAIRSYSRTASLEWTFFADVVHPLAKTGYVPAYAKHLSAADGVPDRIVIMIECERSAWQSIGAKFDEVSIADASFIVPSRGGTRVIRTIGSDQSEIHAVLVVERRYRDANLGEEGNLMICERYVFVPRTTDLTHTWRRLGYSYKTIRQPNLKNK